jgi:hypothetical protein
LDTCKYWGIHITFLLIDYYPNVCRAKNLATTLPDCQPSQYVLLSRIISVSKYVDIRLCLVILKLNHEQIRTILSQILSNNNYQKWMHIKFHIPVCLNIIHSWSWFKYVFSHWFSDERKGLEEEEENYWRTLIFINNFVFFSNFRFSLNDHETIHDCYVYHKMARGFIL